MKKIWWQSNSIYSKISIAFFVVSMLTLLMQLFMIGTNSKLSDSYYNGFKILNFLFGLFSVFISVYLYLRENERFKKYIKFGFIIVSIFYLIAAFQWLINANYLPINNEGSVIFFSVFIAFLSISQQLSNLKFAGLQPALLFVLSFALLVLLGTILILLPSATTKDISIIDALFTITSGVTVTGLSVVDTELTFTLSGQIIIIVFIQLGGLGILTFTNLFSLLFKTENSFSNRLMVGDMIKEINNNNTFTTLGKIIILTLMVELLGAILIYFSVYNNVEISNKFFFSIFHSISAFCNAGFSTLSGNLYDETVRTNYFLHTIVAWLIITGGISFPVMLNHNKLLTRRMNKVFRAFGIQSGDEASFTKVSTNNILVLKTTFILLLLGTILFFITEYHSTLAGHTFLEKIAISFFNSVTPRTAGFNNVDMAQLTIPTVIVCIFLMWIGASPASTGGGIKTTTFALACMNLFNQIKGRNKLTYNWREITLESINQANAVIFLSILAIGVSTVTLSYLEPKMLLKDLLFEVVSAYSTVGLSLGITPQLSDASKIVLIFTMFLGRVSFLTFLIGIFRQFLPEHKREVAQYPKDNIYIN